MSNKKSTFDKDREVFGQDKSNEWLHDRVKSELQDRVEEIHKLLSENERLKSTQNQNPKQEDLPNKDNTLPSSTYSALSWWLSLLQTQRYHYMNDHGFDTRERCPEHLTVSEINNIYQSVHSNTDSARVSKIVSAIEDTIDKTIKEKQDLIEEYKKSNDEREKDGISLINMEKSMIISNLRLILNLI